MQKKKQKTSGGGGKNVGKSSFASAKGGGKKQKEHVKKGKKARIDNKHKDQAEQRKIISKYLQYCKKLWLKQSKEKEIQYLKRVNQSSRFNHKTNLKTMVKMINQRNESDYSTIKKQIAKGQERARQRLLDEEKEKKVKFRTIQDNWISLNLQREKGKIKVSRFHQDKNKEHLKQYQTRIGKEEKRIKEKMSKIQDLAAKQTILREKVEKSTMKSSKMSEFVDRIERVMSPKNEKVLQSLDHSFQDKNQNKFNKTRKKSEQRGKSEGGGEIEENIETLDEEDAKKIFKIIGKRRKNRHTNRYSQFQAF